MLRCLILPLFLLALALPALMVPWQANAATPSGVPAAECHGAAGHTTPASHDRTAPDMTGLHGCIGCIAFTGSAAMPPQSAPVRRLHHVRPIAQLASLSALPDLPPPRS